MATSSSFRFQWRGASIAAQLEAATEEAMEETAAAAEAAAKSFARVDTGEMRDGLGATVQRVSGGVQMVLSGSAPHTIFHEIGTSRINAAPMIRPAIDQEAPKLAGRVRAKLGSMR